MTGSRTKKKPLADYGAKRDFSKTREPKPSTGKARTKAPRPRAALTFVVQKHAARRLHYDLRLELDGVLKSWAVTRGPSLQPGEKRLAVQVEDHPLDYGDFEGTIPQGEYGGGAVIVWDRGTWSSDGDPHAGLNKGHLVFSLRGEKLRGDWHLVRMRARRNETKPQWLLIKSDDEAARTGPGADITATAPLSVKTGRPIEALAHPDTSMAKPALRKQGRAKRRQKQDLPSFIEPCLASLVNTTPQGANFLHEIKFDGYRIQIHCRDGTIRYLSRSGLDYTDKIVPSALHDEIVSCRWNDTIIDGELIVESASGVSDFAALQNALKKGQRERFIFMAFDCLFHDGKDLRSSPLHERKEILQAILPGHVHRVRFSEEIAEGGKALLDHACRLGLEGIVSKRRDAPYRSGRGLDWVKSKCTTRDDFVIAGFTASTAMRRAIGALVLGVYDRQVLTLVGRVGSGFTSDTAQSLYQLLAAHKRPTPPFEVRPEPSLARGAIWTDPVLVADIEFRGVTPDGALRHPVFKGIRDDKEAKSVKRPSTLKPQQAKAEPRPSQSFPLTHPDRIFWPDVGITKQGLADYYDAIFDWIGPHIIRRPLSLIRCPDGVGSHCFFQKHAWAGLSDIVRRVRDPAGDDEWLMIEKKEGLLAFAQAGVLEIHPWGSRIDHIEQPDRIIFDLDPGEGVTWSALVVAAREIKDRLHDLGRDCFVKTSGGKGLHVVVPIDPDHEWDDVKAWTHDFATRMAADTPQNYVATIKKAARRGKILIDYLRNGRGATAIAAFSPRAREGAPVSAPIAWDELDAIAPSQFHLGNIMSRLDHLKTDPWQDFFKVRQSLPLASRPQKPKKGTRRPMSR